MKKILTIIYFLCLAIASNAQNEVTVGNLRMESTYEHISVLYNITNDDNRNSSLTIEYRPQGTTTYLMGAKTMRTHPSMQIDGASAGRNYLAGSAMFLQPNTTYEFRLTVTDPDGGGDVELINWQTSSELTPAANGTIYYVAPGNGGGNGSMNTPFLGLQTAADNASPGDIFMVTDGTYAPFTLTTDGTQNNPIVFQSQNLHGAIIDGGNTNRGIVNIGDFEQSTEEIIIDGFIIQNGTWGINAENTAFLTVKNNIIRDVDFGFVNRRELGLEQSQTIENNSFTGRTAWPGTGIPGERGIDIRGNNNVIRYNTIQYFADGISTDGRAYERAFSLDIHHNDISYCVDDAIEVDFVVANTRIYRNRCYNSRTGVSVAPVFGGPCYIFRNEFMNQEDGFSTYKMNRGPAGIVMVHNTSHKHGYGMSSPSGWQNTYFRNNIIMGTGYVFEEYELVNNGIDDWDYNAFYSTRGGIDQIGSQWFKWDNVRYPTLADLQAGTTIETNGIVLTLNDFNNATLAANDQIAIPPGDRDLTLVNGSAARNSGAVLDNINLPFVTDGQPDRGAFEFGQAYPEYGANFTNNPCTNNTFYADTDNDGYGDIAVSITACEAPTGYVANSDDCDDTNAALPTTPGTNCPNGIIAADGCTCTPTTPTPDCSTIATDELRMSDITETSLYVYTAQPYGAVNNQFRYRVTGAIDWELSDLSTSYYRLLNNLLPGTDYEVQVAQECSAGQWSDFSSSQFFTTQGQMEETSCLLFELTEQITNCQIAIDIIEGMGPYTLTISGPNARISQELHAYTMGITLSTKNLEMGTYEVTLQDANNCAMTQSFTVSPCNNIDQPTAVNNKLTTVSNSENLYKAISVKTIIDVQANYPNPFTTRTHIPFNLIKNSPVTLEVFLATGQQIYQKQYDLEAGDQQLQLQGHLFPESGIYFYRLRTKNQFFSGKLTKL